jgi:hypothetical protein
MLYVKVIWIRAGKDSGPGRLRWSKVRWLFCFSPPSRHSPKSVYRPVSISFNGIFFQSAFPPVGIFLSRHFTISMGIYPVGILPFSISLIRHFSHSAYFLSQHSPHSSFLPVGISFWALFLLHSLHLSFPQSAFLSFGTLPIRPPTLLGWRRLPLKPI